MKRSLTLSVLSALGLNAGLSVGLAQNAPEALPAPRPGSGQVSSALLAQAPDTRSVIVPVPMGPGSAVHGGLPAGGHAPTTGLSAVDGPCGSKGGGWEIGAGFYYLKPHWSDSTAFVRTTRTVDPAGATVAQDVTSGTLHNDPTFAPRVWLGWGTEDGFFIRGSWWRLENNTSLATSVGPSIPGSSTRLVIPSISAASDDILTGGFGVPRQGVMVIDSAATGSGLVTPVSISSRFLLQVADLDLTQQFRFSMWNVRLGGGVRYARLSQSFQASADGPAVGFDLPPGFNLHQSLDLSNTFEGAGPLGVLEVGRGLGNFGLGVYGIARGGVLFGETRLAATQLVQVTNSLGVVTFTNPYQRTTFQRNSMPFLELEGGVEWARNFNPLTPFVRVGVVGQQWFGAGSPTQTANNKQGDLGLFGLQVSAGINF